MTELRVVGGLRVNGRPLRLRTRRAESLLAFLALHPGDHSRDDLLDRFWPDDSPDAARQKLRLALGSIRSELGDALVGDRRTVRLDVRPCDREDDVADPLPGIEGEWAAGWRREWADRRAAALRTLLTEDTDPATRLAKREEIFRRDPDDRENARALDREYRRAIRAGGAGREARRRLRLRHPWLAIDEVAEIAPIAGPTDGFHGRGEETESLAAELLGDREPVWVTLRAPGGTGKTRLARELLRRAPAAEVRPIFVPLADVTDGASARARVDAALYVGGAGDPALLPPTLLVLDNLEQIADPSPLAGLVAPGLSIRVLATSQVATEVPGERVIDLEPLPLPEPGDPAGWDASPSVRLFLDRAAQATGERPGPIEDAVAVCRRLDGQPLALELAAATLDLMDLPTLAKGLDGFAAELRSRGKPPRQRSLKGSVEWSLSLIPESARTALATLAIVDGAPDREGLAALWADPELSFLPLLRDRCLVTRRPGAHPRFELPRAVRDVLAGELEPSSREAARVRWRDHHFAQAMALRDPKTAPVERLSEDFAAMEDAIRARLRSGDAVGAFEAADRLSGVWIAAGIGNARPALIADIRAALLEEGPHWRSAFVLARLATIREDWPEAIRWTDEWADSVPDSDPIHRDLGRANAAFARAMTDDPEGGRDALRRLSGPLNFNDHTIGIAFQQLGRAEERCGDLDRAEAAYRYVIARVNDPFWRGQRSLTEWYLSGLLWATGRHAEAREYLDAAEVGFRVANEPFRRPEILSGRTRLALDGGDDPTEAVREALDLAISTAAAEPLRIAAAGAATRTPGPLATFARKTELLTEADRREDELLAHLAQQSPRPRPTTAIPMIRAALER